jgi:hypothetical protein
MATPRKKPVSKIKTVEDESYSKLEQYCIWLNEYYTALIKAGFKHDMAAMFVMEKDSYPDWVSFKPVKDLLEEEDED